MRYTIFICSMIAISYPAFADWDIEDKQEHGELYEQAAQLIELGRFNDALKALHTADNLLAFNPDVLNLIGYSYRNTGDFDKAHEYYEKALWVQPDHLGALEYQGELYLQMGKINEAKKNLIKIEELCPNGCDERSKLMDAIASTK